METNESKRTLVLVVGCALVLGLLVSWNVVFLGQTAPERFWLAGRYDGNRIIVYFDAVKFGKTVPKDAVKIHYPIADSFFSPVGLPPDYVARVQQKRRNLEPSILLSAIVTICCWAMGGPPRSH